MARPNPVWCDDIPFLPMRRGFMSSVAIRDWQTRKVPVWRISNTLEADFCVEVLNEAVHHFASAGVPNTHKGSRFTSFARIARLRRSVVRISTDAKGRRGRPIPPLAASLQPWPIG